MAISMRLFSILIAALLLAACSAKGIVQRDLLIAELMRDGPVPLSPDNPYVISNLFLGTEVQKSHILKGFIDYRGTPDAIEAAKDEDGRTVIVSYYIERSEQYVMLPHEETWLIKGPQNIRPQALEKLGKLTPSSSDAPIAIATNNSLVEEKTPVAETSAAGTDLEVVKAEPRKPLKEKVVIAPKKKKAEKHRSSGPLHATIEKAESGDILHHISYSGETLRLVSMWYTGTADNAERLARINSFSNPDVLTLGQLVRIPRYMLKRNEPLPEVEVRKYYLKYSNKK